MPAGVHSWYAKDTEGCIYSGSSTITQPDGTTNFEIYFWLINLLQLALGVSHEVTSNTCYGSAAGSVSLFATGGTGPYTYSVCVFKWFILFIE